ncbi:hypothetical protein [Caballeronia sp. LZ035]|uniref:hypothetical protein n=1 Tax=Caballeronia sp. LZ035 TaxID=3038568 RepID=UPI00285CF4DC|nr:hypothetical protein [Caballeronia sp. LZ035]MDR5759094.1 hypothetical protein [Caballeronia sp. LZ035]
MQSDDEPKYIPDQNRTGLQRDAPGLLVKVLAAIVGCAVLVAAFFVSLFLLVILLAVGLLFGAYIWWKTRELRRLIRERAGSSTPEGEVIENVEFKETTSARRE